MDLNFSVSSSPLRGVGRGGWGCWRGGGWGDINQFTQLSGVIFCSYVFHPTGLAFYSPYALTWHTASHSSRSGLTAAVQAYCGNLSGNELTHNLPGNTRPQSSQLAESLWTDPSLNSGISVRELISTKKKKKKSTGGE